MLHHTTGVWRKRGITSLENIFGTASCVARGKYVEAPPAPSPRSLAASGGQRSGTPKNLKSEK